MADPEIVQVVRHMHPNGGVGGVAWALQREFDALGVRNRVLSLESFVLTPHAPGRSRLASKLRQAAEIVAFTVLATPAVARLSNQPGVVTLNHGDPLGGDVWVNHGLHRAAVAAAPHMLLRNPLHLFMLAREAFRHRLRLHRRTVCLTAAGREELARLHPASRGAPVTVIPNGIDLARFTAPPARPAAAGGPLRLIFVGHEFERKGLRFAIDALASLPARVSLTVVGGSDAEIAAARRQAERAGVAERVSLLGRRMDVPALLREADILLLPSAVEAWPLVALEAMASGAPVMMTRVSGAEELVGDGSAGLVIARSAASIAEAVQGLLDGPEHLDALRAGAVSRARAFPWRDIAARYVALAAEVQIEKRDRMRRQP